MALHYPFGTHSVLQAAPGTHVRALITYVHDRFKLKFTIRIVNGPEFQLTDAIEYTKHSFKGYGLSAQAARSMFGLGIKDKVYRAIFTAEPAKYKPSAYLIDIGFDMPIQQWDPIYALSPFMQAIPGTAINCSYAGSIDPCMNLKRWFLVQEQLQEDTIVVLKVKKANDHELHVVLADDPYEF